MRYELSGEMLCSLSPRAIHTHLHLHTQLHASRYGLHFLPPPRGAVLELQQVSEMDEVLGHRPASRPPVLLDTSAPLDLSEEMRGEEERHDIKPILAVF